MAFNKHKAWHGPPQPLSTAIVLHDCGTTDHDLIDFNRCDPKNFLGAFLITRVGLLRLEPENINLFAGQVVRMRSSLKCKGKPGCKICYRLTAYVQEPPTVKE